MSPVALSFSTVLALAAAVTISSVSAQQSTFPPTPLADKHFAYPTEVPYKVDTDTNLIRGQQTGYNICNSTTENQASLCQTAFINSIDDFCLWGPKDPGSIVANIEGEMISWCTKPGHGSRLIPNDALKGVQFMRTPDYVQVVGFIDQTKINMASDDWGGEMDPHGADLRGNPMGGLFYSNSFGTDKNKFTQVIEWHNFMGGNAFCLKACDPAGPNAAHFCEHRFDRIGCAYNAPNNAQNGTFEACKGDNQDFPGIYTLPDGTVATYTQPPEDAGSIQTMPYQPKVPASSECETFTSSVLFAALASVTAPGDATSAPASTPTAGGSSNANTSGGSGVSTRGTGTGTGSAQGAQGTSNDAETMVVSGVVTLFGVVFSAMFFA